MSVISQFTNHICTIFSREEKKRNAYLIGICQFTKRLKQISVLIRWWLSSIYGLWQTWIHMAFCLRCCCWWLENYVVLSFGIPYKVNTSFKRASDKYLDKISLESNFVASTGKFIIFLPQNIERKHIAIEMSIKIN